MVLIESDDQNMNRFARSRHGGHAAVIIQKKTTGHVQIFTNKHYDIRIGEVVKLLRSAEFNLSNPGENLPFEFDELDKEGALDAIPEWYYFVENGSVMNGSLKNTGVPHTKLELAEIVAIVKSGLLRTPAIKDGCRLRQDSNISRKKERFWRK